MRESSAPHPCCLTPLWAFVLFQSCSYNAGTETEQCAVRQEEAPFATPSCPPGLAATSETWQLHSLPVMLLSETFCACDFDHHWTIPLASFTFFSVLIFFSELRVEILRNSRKKKGSCPGSERCGFASLKAGSLKLRLSLTDSLVFLRAWQLVSSLSWPLIASSVQWNCTLWLWYRKI